MSDHKWDRFKRAFGGKPSDDLVLARTQKIADELGKVATQLSALTLAGLDGGVVKTRRDDLARRRDDALKLKTNKEKCDALDPIKDDARQLVADAPGIIDGRLQALTREVGSERSRIKFAVDDAKSIKTPLCQQAIAGTLATVEQEAGDAERLPDDVARRDGLRDVDVGPLQNAVRGVKVTEKNVQVIPAMTELATKNVEGLPDGDQKDQFARDLKTATDEVPSLANLTDMTTLGTEALRILKAINAVGKQSGDLGAEIKSRQTVLGSINRVLVPAKAFRSKVGQAIVGAEVLRIETAMKDAEKLDPERARIDALKQIDLNPMVMALASARDLDAGIPGLLASATTMIGDLPRSKQKTDFGKELARLQNLADGLDSEADYETARKSYAALRTPANALMQAVITASGDKGYENALNARFGVTITKNDNAKVNLVGAYDMLNQVPDSHVGHDKLTKLFFTASKEGGGAYKDGKIDMDNFGEGNDGYVYVLDGKKVKPNGFNVCMLHEIGHAVDDKYKIMAGLMDTAGYGKWRDESRQSAKQAIVDAAVKELGNPAKPVADAIDKAIEEALGGKEPAKPNEISAPDWKKVRKYTGIAVAITVDKKPWFNSAPTAIAIDGRCYIQSYKETWSSFEASEVPGQNVRDYQWRAPGEWFADLYGVLWMVKKPAPSGVGPAIARWLPT